MGGGAEERAARRSGRRGDMLVECLVALAVSSAVFVPALAALRGALRLDAATARRAEGAAAARPAARSAATALRLGAETESVAVVEAPVRTVVRAGEGRAVASALGVVAALEAPPPLRPDPPPAPQGSRGPSQK